MKKKRWVNLSAWVTFELFFFAQIVSAGNIVGPSLRHSHLRAPSFKGTSQPDSSRDGGIGQFVTELRGVKDGGTQNLETFPPLLRDYLTSVTGVMEDPDWLRQVHALFTSVDPQLFLRELERMDHLPKPTSSTMYSRLDAPLYYDDEHGFVVLVASWEPGQSTHIHNHLTENETPEEGLIGVLEGEAEVVHFRREGNRIIEAGRFILREGQAAIVRKEAGQIHRVRNAGRKRLRMFDTYRPRLTRTDIFLPLQDDTQHSLFRGKTREEYVIHPIRIPAGKQNLLLPELLVEANLSVTQIDELLRTPITVKATSRALNEAKALVAGRDGADRQQPVKESAVEIAGATFLHLSAERPVATVLIPEPIDPAVIQRIRERGDISAFILTPESEEVKTEKGWRAFSQEQLEEAVQQVNPTAIVGYTNLRYDARLMDAAPNLRGIFLFSTGRENVDHLAALRRGIWATYAPGPLTDLVSEHNLTFLLDATLDLTKNVRHKPKDRWIVAEETLVSLSEKNPEVVVQLLTGELLRRTQRLDEQYEHVRQGKFRRTTGVSENATVLHDQLAHNSEIGIETTVGLIGLGKVGKRLAEVAQALGVKEIRYHVPERERDEAAEKELGLVYIPSSKELLKSDYVVRLPGAGAHLRHEFQNRIVDPETLWILPSYGETLAARSLVGKTARIAGLGRIGGKTARLAVALGMNVTAIEKFPKEEIISALNTQQQEFAKRNRLPVQPLRLAEDKEAFLKGVQPGDVILIQFDYSPEVFHWLDEKALSLLGETPVTIVNTARGKLADTATLIRYADAHPDSRIRVDVLENETEDTEKGLAERPNVGVTPHAASANPAVRRRMAEVAVIENLFAVLDGNLPAYPMPEVPVHEVVARQMFREAVKSADAREAVRRHVVYHPSSQTLTVQGRSYDLSGIQNIYVIGYGKASGEMAEALTEILGNRITSGVVNVAGYDQKKRFNGAIKPITVYAGDHPVPGLEGPKGTEEMIALVRQAGPKDMVISLISGGGSAIGAHPVFKISLKDLQVLYRLLESTPIPIHEKNIIRKHLDARADLLRVSRNAKHFVSLIISDVPGDDPHDIASGYTVGETSTFRDVKELLQKYHLWGRIPASIRNFIEQNVIADPIFEQVRPHDPLFYNDRVQTAVLVGNYPALERAAEVARAWGYETRIIQKPLTRTVEEEAVHIMEEIIEAGDARWEKPLAILWGGETVVDLPSVPGRGGRNSHLALEVARDLADLDLPDVTFLAASTDGKDGSWDGTGAVVTGRTVVLARQAGLEPAQYLRGFNSGTFAEKAGIDITTGPTGTNVMDVAFALIPPGAPEEARDGTAQHTLSDISNEAVRSWVEEIAAFVGAGPVYPILDPGDVASATAGITRSQEDVATDIRQRMQEGSSFEEAVKQMIQPGMLIRRNNGTSVSFSHPTDVARMEKRTFVASDYPEDAGVYNNHRMRDDIVPVVKEKIRGSYAGKPMYVIPLLMGPPGGPVSKVIIMVTDSPYVLANQEIMASYGEVALRELETRSDLTFIPGIHGTGDLDKITDADRHFVTVMDQNEELAELWSFGSAYGGNAILGKKLVALRLASYLAARQGWLAEHRAILPVRDLVENKQYGFFFAAPSASGKSNFAMMRPPKGFVYRYQTEFFGDDIAWIAAINKVLYGTNPEGGSFGVLPETNWEKNPVAMEAIGDNTGTIFTNVAYNVFTGEVWWRGLTPQLPTGEGWINWQRKPATPETIPDPKQWANENSRYTTRITNFPNVSPLREDPNGVPVDAFMVGGKMSKGFPLIYQSRPEDGIYDEFMLIREATAAATDVTVGAVDPDPDAMKPFFGPNEGDYLRNRYERLEELEKVPGFFHVNWFLKGEDGKFLWPGYGWNVIALIWAKERLHGNATGKGEAVETPLGYVPTPAAIRRIIAEELDETALDEKGRAALELILRNLDQVTFVDPEFVKAEAARRTQFLEKFKEDHREKTGREIVFPSEFLEAHERFLERAEAFGRSSDGGYRNLRVGELTLKTGVIPDLLAMQVEKYGDRTFLVVPGPDGYREISFNQFNANVERMTKALHHYGVKQGDRVAFLSPNRPQFAESAMGVWRLGGAVVSMSFRAPMPVLEHMISVSDATSLVVSAGPFLQAARALKVKNSNIKKIFVLDPLPLEALQEDEISLASWQEGATPVHVPSVDITPADLALVLFTSGTTKLPKGVPLTHQNLLYNREASHLAWKGQLTDEDMTLGWLPFFHVMGLPFEFLGNLYVGAKYAFPRLKPGPPTPDQLLTALKETEANVFYSVPWMLEGFQAMAGQDPTVLDELRRLKFIMSGGVVLSREVGEYFQGQGINVIQGEGMTDVGGAIFLANPARRDWRTLQIIPGMNADFVAIPGFEGGELVLDHSPTVTSGYLKNDEATRESFKEEGRFYTGDLFAPVEGVQGGYVYVGRNDETNTHTTGEKTYPLPIEMAIEEHPAVARVALVGNLRPYNVAVVLPDYAALQGKHQTEVEEAVWEAFERVNPELPDYSRVLRQNLIIVPPGVTLPLSPKGSLIRPQVEKQFADEIEERFTRKARGQRGREERDVHFSQTHRRTRGLSDIVKRTTQRDFALSLIEGRRRAKKVTIGGESLNIPRLVAVSRDGVAVRLTSSTKVREKVDRSVAWLRTALENGADVYGVTAGFGGSADVRTHETIRLQQELIRFLNATFGEELLVEDVRASMLIRVNSNIKGYSGLRWLILDNVVTLLNKGITPVVPARGSITASGDLAPLSHILAVLMGKESAKAHYQGKIISAKEALEIAGLEPVVLGPKEGLAFVNGTSVANAVAGTTLYDAHVASLLTQAVTALSVEALLGTNQSYDPLIQEVKGHPGQVEVGENLLGLLRGSQLARDELGGKEKIEPGRMRQDRYALRTATQWLGPQLEVLLDAAERVTTEMNAVSDNPLIDAEGDRSLHGGNFQGTPVSVSMENTRLAIQAIGKLIFAQYSELVNKAFNNGLPANLAGGEPNIDFGLKGAEIAMAGYMSELAYLANPVTTHVQSAELHNQDVNSLGLISARMTRQATTLLQMMLASHLYASTQAVDLRNIERTYQQTVEETVVQTLEETLPKAVKNAPAVMPAAKDYLLRQVRRQLPFEYVFTSKDQYRPLFYQLAGKIDDVLRGDPEAVGEIKVELVDGSQELAPYYIEFEKALARRLDVALPRAKTQALQRGGAYLLGNTRPLYEFVRRGLGVRFESGDQDAGPEIEKIFNAIQDGRIVEPLLDAFFPMPTVEEWKASQAAEKSARKEGDEAARDGGGREAIRGAGRTLAGLLRSKLTSLRDNEEMPVELRRVLSQDVQERIQQQLNPAFLGELGDVARSMVERTLRDAAILTSLSLEDAKGMKRSVFFAGRILEDINQYASSSGSLRASWHAPRDPSGKVIVDPRYEKYREAIWKHPSHWNFEGIRGLLGAVEEETLKETLRQFAENGETFVVAEVGTGNGPLTQELIEMFKRFGIQNYKILATDVNASWLASAYERYGDKESPHYDPAVEFYLVRSEDEQGRSFRDFEKLSTTLGGQKVHLVIGSHAIHLIGQFDQFAAGVRETLLPGGFAAFQSLNVEYPGRLLANGEGPFLIDDTANRVHDLAVELIQNDERYASYRERVTKENVQKALPTRRAVFPPVRDQSEYLMHLKDQGFGILVPSSPSSYPAEYIHVLYEDWGEFLKLELLQNGILPELHKTPVQSEVIAKAVDLLFKEMRRANIEKKNPFTGSDSFIVGSTIIIAKLGTEEEKPPVEPERFAEDGGEKGVETERREALVAYLDGILDAIPAQGPFVISLDAKVEPLAAQFALPPETVKQLLRDSDVFQVLPDGQITFDRNIGEDSEALRFFAMTAKKWAASARDGASRQFQEASEVPSKRSESRDGGAREILEREMVALQDDIVAAAHPVTGEVIGSEGLRNIIDVIRDEIVSVQDLIERMDQEAKRRLRPELSPIAKILLRDFLVLKGVRIPEAFEALPPLITANYTQKDLAEARQIVKEVLVGL